MPVAKYSSILWIYIVASITCDDVYFKFILLILVLNCALLFCFYTSVSTKKQNMFSSGVAITCTTEMTV